MSTVCVRLCDGYFFPAESAAACGARCPGAATEAFFQPPGADGIDKAISVAGQKYTGLPNAYRYRTAFDETCSCHNGMANASLLALSDPTLRRGDVVMTQNGMKVFQGAGSLKGASAFLGLAKAAMPPEKRSILFAMEKASAPRAVAQRAAQAPDHAPVAAKAPRHMRTASLHWPLVGPRSAGGFRALSVQRPGFRGYDLGETYW